MPELLIDHRSEEPFGCIGDKGKEKKCLGCKEYLKKICPRSYYTRFNLPEPFVISPALKLRLSFRIVSEACCD